MKLKIKSLMIAALTLLCGTSATAYDFEHNGFYYNIKSLSDLTVSLTCNENNCYSGDVVIPSTAEWSGKTFTVTEVEGDAFSNCSINQLIMPESVLKASISGNIDFLKIEDSNTPILSLRVQGVRKTYIGRDNVAYYPYSFSYSSLEEVEFGNKVTSIGAYYFQECSQLKSVKLSSSIKRIEKYAFQYCSALTTIYGRNVETIECGAFDQCSTLETFDFPALKSIDNGDSQWGTYRWGVFQGCTSLKQLVLPQGLLNIGTMAFKDCKNLESVTLPASLMAIGDSYNAEHSSVFANCENLTSIISNSKNPIKIGETTFDVSTYIKATLRVPVGSKEAYQNADGWKNFFNIVEDVSINDDVCGIRLSYDYGGNVRIESKDEKCHFGEEIKLVFEPDENYAISSVKVNGDEMKFNVKNNCLLITLEGNTVIDVEFDKDYYEDEDDEYSNLTIKQGDQGSLVLKVREWSTYNFSIVPENNYKIHSVTYNGKDITDYVLNNNGKIKLSEIFSDAILNVAFESTLDGIIQSEASRARVFGEDGAIRITGYSDGESVSVYNVNGQLIQSQTLIGVETRIPVESGQVYVVKLSGKSVKLVI